MLPLQSLTTKMLKWTYYMLQLGHDIQNSYWTQCRWRPYWIFAHKKVSPRVAEFGDFEHVFTCLNLSYGTKIAFLPICSRSSHSTDRHLGGDSGDDRSKLECNRLVFLL